MLLQIKIYLVGILYFFGVLFMILFPPRNYSISGAKTRTRRSISNNLTFTSFVTPSTLPDIIDRLASNNREVAKVLHLQPTTAGNRSIMALELRSDKQTIKPGILIVGGMQGVTDLHGNRFSPPRYSHVSLPAHPCHISGELNPMAWAAPNAILELAEKLIYDPSYQTPFFNDYDWYLIPMANPDGLQFAQSLSHLQPVETSVWSRNLTLRQSTRPMEWFKNIDNEDKDTLCFGTNVNRNFAYHWQDDVRITPDICSQLYPGEKPFSSAEAQAIRRYVDHLGDTIHLSIHLHASLVFKKEYILYPWRYSTRQPSNYRTLQEIGEYAARFARLPDGRLYEVHQSSNDGKVAGSFSDYVCGVVGVDLVFIIKPYHDKFPNITDINGIDTYVKKSLTAIQGLVRGWRSSTKLNTLSFFGRDVEF